MLVNYQGNMHSSRLPTAWVAPVSLVVLACSGKSTISDVDPAQTGGGGQSDGSGGAAGGAAGSGNDTTGSGWRFESLGFRKSTYASEPEAWVVNAAVHGTGQGELLVAGYVSGVAGMGLGFVDRLVDGRLEPEYQQDQWFWGLWASSASLAFGVGHEVVRLGSRGPTLEYSTSDASTVLFGIWGSGSQNVVAVGDGGLIVRYDGQQWSTEDSGVHSRLHAVWGPDPDRLYAAGDGGLLLAGAAGTWTRVASPSSEDLDGIWGSGASDVYVVGGNETLPGHAILHFDGSSWSTVHSGDERKSTLLGVWGTSSTDVMAVGAYRDDSGDPHAEILHFDGKNWVEIPNDLTTFLWDVWCARAGDCYVVGPDDTVVRVTRTGE